MSRPETKGSMEAQISSAITQFERQHLGRGPQEVRTWIIQDLILVRLKGVLTPAEWKLSGDDGGHHREFVAEKRRPIVADALCSPVVTIAPTTCVENAAQLMLERKIGALPVLVGVLTDAGLLQLLVPRL